MLLSLGRQRKQLNESIIEHVKRGQNIPLDNFYIAYMANKISPYEIRGNSFLLSLLALAKKEKSINEKMDSNVISQTLMDINLLYSDNEILKDVFVLKYKQIFSMLEHWINNKFIKSLLIMNGYGVGTFPTIEFDVARLTKDIAKMKKRAI